jgi:hypothetical protein
MHLLVIVLHREDLLDEVLSGMVEMEITGAAVLEGTSMEQVLSDDVPVFAGLFQTTGGAGQTRTILASVPDPKALDPLVQHLDEVGVHLKDPEVGSLFALPVDFYHGP